jgi:hypothetical protein
MNFVLDSSSTHPNPLKNLVNKLVKKKFGILINIYL